MYKIEFIVNNNIDKRSQSCENLPFASRSFIEKGLEAILFQGFSFILV